MGGRGEGICLRPSLQLTHPQSISSNLEIKLVEVVKAGKPRRSLELFLTDASHPSIHNCPHVVELVRCSRWNLRDLRDSTEPHVGLMTDGSSFMDRKSLL